MAKFDYKKDLKELYFPPSKNPVLVDVPAMNFVMVDGMGGRRRTPSPWTGPFSEEGPTVARLHEFIKESGHSSQPVSEILSIGDRT